MVGIMHTKIRLSGPTGGLEIADKLSIRRNNGQKSHLEHPLQARCQRSRTCRYPCPTALDHRARLAQKIDSKPLLLTLSMSSEDN
jgi:hypothetical protein